MNVLADQEVLYRALGVQRLLNVNDVIRLLRSEVKRAGSQRAFARKAGVNVSVVSKTLRGMVLPSEKILSALDLRVVYFIQMTLCVAALRQCLLLPHTGHFAAGLPMSAFGGKADIRRRRLLLAQSVHAATFHMAAVSSDTACWIPSGRWR